MTQKEKDTLIHLLKKLKSENLLIPYMPLDVWYAVNSIIPLPAVEVLLTRSEKDFLLTYRRDNLWDGWHIPGGFIAYKETLADACDRVARRELGISVKFEKLVTAYVWQDHPYAGSISLVCKCTALEEPKEGKFFTEIPKDIIRHHGEFIQEFLR